MMPHFSYAISSRVFPRNSIWSYEILVMIERIGVRIFVASSLPPIPTSITAYSQFCSLKYIKARSVLLSKYDNPLPYAIIFSAIRTKSTSDMRPSHSSCHFDRNDSGVEKSCSKVSQFPTINLSRISILCGLVYTPTLFHDSLSI